MARLALLARLEAEPGKEKDVEQLLRRALPLAQAEEEGTRWLALRLGPSTFGIYDTFDNEARLKGPLASALLARAGELLAWPPVGDAMGARADEPPR